MRIAPAPDLTLRKHDPIHRFDCRNLFFWHHIFLQPEADPACGLSPRVAASLRRLALLGRQSGHERS